MRNEAAIDAGITNAQGSFFVFLQERLRILWDLALKFGAQVQAAQSSQSQAGGGGGAAPATGSPADAVSKIWRAFGPSVLAGLTRTSVAVRARGRRRAVLPRHTRNRVPHLSRTRLRRLLLLEPSPMLAPHSRPLPQINDDFLPAFFCFD